MCESLAEGCTLKPCLVEGACSATKITNYRVVAGGRKRKEVEDANEANEANDGGGRRRRRRRSLSEM
jgi:hypothetical protein